jgi:hypothetical protein
MKSMADTYDGGAEGESNSGSGAKSGATSLFMTLGAFALYLFGTAGLLLDRVDALVAGDLHTWVLALLLLAPLVAFGALFARRGGT